jgi:glycosyltransferase involved in cell wall biosynthesis
VAFTALVLAAVVLGNSTVQRIVLTVLAAAALGAQLLLIAAIAIPAPEPLPAPSPANENAAKPSAARHPAVAPPAQRHPSLNTAPDVTVVVAARNESSYIEACLSSIASQTFQNFECLVFDDASTDDTATRAFDRFSADPRFHFFSNDTPQGLAGVRNQGIGIARGRYITFVDGDDAVFPDALEVRLRVATAHEGPASWSAGSYCDWRAVPESYTLEETPRARDRDTVTWFTALTDAPFIASAPLLRTDVVRSLSGFDERLDTAEDAEFETRLLRNGYIVTYAPTVGVAYRQKRRSMFRDTAGRHAATIGALVASNYEPMPEAMIVERSPHPYREPAGTYLPRITEFRRLVVGLAVAMETGDGDAVDQAALAVAAAYEPYLAHVLDLDDLARQGTWRATVHAADLSGKDPNLEAAVKDRLDLIVRAHGIVPAPPLSGNGGTASLVREGPPARRLQTIEHVDLNDAQASQRLSGRVVLSPSAGYHVADLAPLAQSLGSAQIPTVILVPKAFWETTAPALRPFGFEVYPQPDPGEWVARLAGLVTLNDWGIHTKDIVVAAENAGVPTFAKIEGVQDFEDDDVPWKRDAYQTVRHVLAQGQNDVDALPGKDATIVGSTRLERIWLASPRPYRQDLAVINLNFTYGVLEDSRDLWLSTAVEGCEHAGLPYIVSLHPAERDRYEGQVPIAEQPMRHLLTGASVLVSRFSTVPFEAMARGVPFVYHNPHGEQVPTFAEPDGAFETSDDAASLAAAIKDSQPWVANYRDRAASFFLRQVDVDPERPSEVRGAEAIVAILAEQG